MLPLVVAERAAVARVLRVEQQARLPWLSPLVSTFEHRLILWVQFHFLSVVLQMHLQTQPESELVLGLRWACCSLPPFVAAGCRLHLRWLARIRSPRQPALWLAAAAAAAAAVLLVSATPTATAVLLTRSRTCTAIPLPALEAALPLRADPSWPVQPASRSCRKPRSSPRSSHPSASCEGCRKDVRCLRNAQCCTTLRLATHAHQENQQYEYY